MRTENILDDFDFEGNQLPEWAENGEVLAKFYSPMEAEIAAARLRAEGLHCFLANAGSHSVLPQLQTVIRLHVRADEFSVAREILKEADLNADMEQPSPANSSTSWITMAIAIGLLLAFLLAQALSM
jgi:hypothetical protein